MKLRLEVLALLALAGCNAAEAPKPKSTHATELDALAEARRDCPDLAGAISTDPEGDARKAFAAHDRAYRLIRIEGVAITTSLVGVDKADPTRTCPALDRVFRSILAGGDTQYCPSMEGAARAYATRYNREVQSLCADPGH